MVPSLGVYVSVPFCKAKCSFCNFASDVFGADRMDQYVGRISQEIRAASSFGDRLPATVDTIYFGGGTPSLLSAANFRRIFEDLRSQFKVADNAEITLECAPGQLSDETLEELLRQGLNRISFGVQSFVDRESASVGRLHTRAQCEAEISRVRSAGLSDINLDLIVGLPYQTQDSWRTSLEHAIASGSPHISVYMLEVDEESRLGREMLKQGSRYGAAEVPNEDQAADWYQQGCDRLNAAGILQYEISNFALPGHRSLHNLKYWQRQPYIGFGLDAHSMLLDSRGAVRFANTSDLDQYLGAPSAEASFHLLDQARQDSEPVVDIVGPSEAFEESLFLGLRLTEGVSLQILRRQFGSKLLHEAMPSLLEVRDAGLLELSSDHIRLTPRGRLVSNEVFSRLLIPSAA
jgi:oxygen-independent coproporphyrinogen-3 oxidase